MAKDVPAAPRTAAKAPDRLRRRKDFVRASKSGARLGGPIFGMQMVARGEDREGAARFGVTVTKKVAGAVGRNRIRRRLKEALRLSGASGARAGHDYVLVARPLALTAPFPQLLFEVTEGLARLQRRAPQPSRREPKKGRLPAS